MTAARRKVDHADTLAATLHRAGFPDFEREYRFAAHLVGGPGKGLRARLLEAGLKDWRFDLAWRDLKVAVEVDGGVWTGGRHGRGAGMVSDRAKLSTAVSYGWRVLVVTPEHIKSGDAQMWVGRTLGCDSWRRWM